MRRPPNAPTPRKGQVWMRKKDKIEAILTAGSPNPRSKNLQKPWIQHHITIKDLWMYWDYMGNENTYESPIKQLQRNTPLA